MPLRSLSFKSLTVEGGAYSGISIFVSKMYLLKKTMWITSCPVSKLNRLYCEVFLQRQYKLLLFIPTVYPIPLVKEPAGCMLFPGFCVALGLMVTRQ